MLYEDDETLRPVEQAFRSRAEFAAFADNRPLTSDREHIRRMADVIHARGALATRRFGPCDARVVGENFREDIHVLRMPSRCFALLDLIDLATGGDRNTRILCTEGLSSFARIIKALYPRAVCSEFAPDPEDQARIAPIPHVDLQAIPFGTAAFDALLTSDVFEHVPDLPLALSECRRVLRPGGVMIATFPFGYNNDRTIQRAVLEKGQVRHLVEPPEYHGDPVRKEDAALVFQLPGWDILDTCRDAGFAKAEMIFSSDTNRGLLDIDLDGLWTLRCFA